MLQAAVEINDGELGPGDPATLTIDGTLAVVNGLVRIAVDGPASCGRLVVTGQVALGRSSSNSIS